MPRSLQEVVELTNKKVELVSFQPITLLEMYERQTYTHIGQDAVAKGKIHKCMQIQNIIYVYRLANKNKVAIACIISNIRLCVDYIALPN